MLNRLSAFLITGGIIAAALVVVPEGESTFSQTDCRSFTGTPTNSPTPSPSPPFVPFEYGVLCNNTNQTASDLHVVLSREAATLDPFWQDPPGCPEPAYTYSGGTSPGYTRIDIDWGTACVQPGEYVDFTFAASCTTPEPGCSPPRLVCINWTLDDAPLPSATWAVYHPRGCDPPTPTPSPSSTPGPGACPPRPAPPPPYPTHPPTPYTVGPTSRDVILTNNALFCNDSGLSASDLHIYMAHPYSAVEVESNAPGCPEPVFSLDPQPWDKLLLDVDWGEACVDDGESLLLRFTYGCGDSPCILPDVYCYTWTLNDVFLDSEGACPEPTHTPTPTPAGGGDCPPRAAPPVTPATRPPTPPYTPIPNSTDRDVVYGLSFTFCNDTFEAASDLHIQMASAYSFVSVEENAPGCPHPWLARTPGSLDDYELDLDWGEGCVSPGESITLNMGFACWQTCDPPLVYCFTWTSVGDAIDGQPPCAGTIRTRTPTPHPTSAPVAWGDTDCNYHLAANDGVYLLMYLAGLPTTSSSVPYCPAFEDVLSWTGHELTWGDIDCDGLITPSDVLAFFKSEAGLPTPHLDDCPQIGSLIALPEDDPF